MRETNARCFCASTSKCAGGSANTTDHIKALWTTKLQVHQMLRNAAVMRPRGSERKCIGDAAATIDPIKQPADRNAAKSMLCNATVMRPHGSERKRVGDEAATTGPISMPRKKSPGISLNFCPNSL
ncbi:hypothetical protein B0H17DRAFT_1190289 [Mycena rosella]|uniref:Uncharacterized protein n=1 Tax=Mycena rosella TaxID=1033263 RepID=A0AAD7H298_MYCRO|nr:hypothetical protein B0H17DRAFT_1190289 [Mycena rosella]